MAGLTRKIALLVRFLVRFLVRLLLEGPTLICEHYTVRTLDLETGPKPLNEWRKAMIAIIVAMLARPELLGVIYIILGVVLIYQHHH